MLSFTNYDFTLYKFRQLCEAIVRNYPTVTVSDYLEKKHPERFVIMRHDIDRLPGNALKTAKIEQELGIRATYYFRACKHVFRPSILKQISDMGHEVGYHYETLSESRGDYEKAIELFRLNLDNFRKICDIKTICMHGRPLSIYDNRDMWNFSNYRDFGIIGEAYLSFEEGFNYFTDTGRTWGRGHNIRDFIPDNNENIQLNTTDSLIKLIESKELNNLYILVHPERWSSNLVEWSLYYSADQLVNIGKSMLIQYNNVNEKLASIKQKKGEGTMSVTVDVEDWYHVPSVCGSSFSVYKDVDDFFDNWKERYDYLSEPTKRTLDLLDEYNVTATFFVVADIAENYPGLIESISERGHEVACHGTHHTCKINLKTKEPIMTVEQFEADATYGKKVLEKITGQKVVGYRAPNAAVTGDMLDALEKAGYKYDSSVCVNSFYNKTDSLLNGVSTSPYYPVPGGLEPVSSRNFVEFPWSYYEKGIKIPTSGGPMLRFLGSHMILRGLRQSLKRGHTIFYFHPIDISNEKFPSVGKGRPFYWVIKGDVIERRIRHILDKTKDVRKVPLRDVLSESYRV